MKLTLSLVIPNSMKVNPKKKKQQRMDIFKANSCAVCTFFVPVLSSPSKYRHAGSFKA